MHNEDVPPAVTGHLARFVESKAYILAVAGGAHASEERRSRWSRGRARGGRLSRTHIPIGQVAGLSHGFRAGVLEPIGPPRRFGHEAVFGAFGLSAKCEARAVRSQGPPAVRPAARVSALSEARLLVLEHTGGLLFCEIGTHCVVGD